MCPLPSCFSKINIIRESTEFLIHDTVRDLSSAERSFLEQFGFRQERLDVLGAFEEQESLQYAFLSQKNEIIAFAFFQTIEFSIEEIESFVKSWQKFFINLFFKKVRLLVIGHPYISGFTPYAARDTESLRVLLKKIKFTGDYDALLVKDLMAGLSLKIRSFTEFEVDSNMIFYIPDAMQSFDDYLSALSSKYRQRYKSALKKSKVLEVRELTAEDIDNLEDDLFQLYGEIVDLGKFKVAPIDRGYFSELKKKISSRLRVFGYFQNSIIVGFRSSIQFADFLEAHYVGYKKSLNSEMKIYQRILYDYIAEGLERKKRKIKYISFGRTATEIKSTVGAVEVPLLNLLYLKNQFLNKMAPLVLKKLKKQYQLRYPFKRG